MMLPRAPGSHNSNRPFPTSSALGRAEHREVTTSVEHKMPEQTKRGRAQDRAKVAGGQKHEVSYDAEKTGSSTSEVKEAVKVAGNSRKRSHG